LPPLQSVLRGTLRKTHHGDTEAQRKTKALPQINADERGFKRGVLRLAFPIVEITLSRAITGLFPVPPLPLFLCVSNVCSCSSRASATP
jgi:hypothetical protein